MSEAYGAWKCSRALCDWKVEGNREDRSRHDHCPKCGACEICFQPTEPEQEDIMVAFEAIAHLALSRCGKRGPIREKTVQRLGRIALILAKGIE